MVTLAEAKKKAAAARKKQEAKSSTKARTNVRTSKDIKEDRNKFEPEVQKEFERRYDKAGERKTDVPFKEPTQLSEAEETERARAESNTIYLNQKKEKEKTGISALREEDSTVGALVRAATDWRTTVALVATLGTLGIGSAAIGAVGTKTAAAATLAKFPAAGIALGYASNAKSAALTTSLLAKAGMTVGVAAGVATVVGTYPFAEFELAEATDKIGIAIFKAAEAGDVEEVERLKEILEDMVNESTWENIVSKIPFANVLQNVKKNVTAAQVSAKSILSSTEKKLQHYDDKRKADEEYYANIEEQNKIKKEAERKADKEYFEDIEKEKRKTKKKERAEDKIYWDDIETKRKKDKKEERAADDAYWKKITESNDKKKADDREADEAYWKEIKEQNTTEPWTPADKAVVDNWNAGKSALNFGWLFL